MGRTIAVSLLKKYLSGSCSPGETEEVDLWFDSMDEVPDNLVGLSAGERSLVEAKIFERILHQIHEKETKSPTIKISKPIYSKVAIWAAASIVLALTTFLIWRYQGVFSQQSSLSSPQFAMIKPGGNKAILTLENGASVVLNEANLGTVINERNVNISKTADGEVSYKKLNTDNATITAYHKLTTPAGGKYSIVLPDGTKAWLNSKSSLRFPTSFNGTERNVEMTGEVYFEVAKNAKQPFKVHSNGTQITVLGTHFNVMAYDDEPQQKTTLLEGSIRLTSGKLVKLLQPGQQATVDPSGIQLVDHSDLEAVMGWKNDLFVFKNMEIREIGLQLSRWYDIKVVFKGAPSKILYNGTIPKDVMLTELLSMLQFTGLKYELDYRVLTIIE